MAKRRTENGRKGADLPQFFCRDCEHSYDWHSRALDGHLILCRCPFYKEGKWCIFLSDRACEHFIKRRETDNGKEEQSKDGTAKV